MTSLRGELKQAIVELAQRWERESHHEEVWAGNCAQRLQDCAAELRALVGARRTWATGDPEPEESGLNLVDNRGSGSWFRGTDEAWSGPYGYSLRWEALLDMHGPMTEARP